MDNSCIIRYRLLGATFDGPLNLRAPAPVLSDAQDADDGQNVGGVDMLSGFNVSSITIEVPRALVTPTVGSQIGVYASTSRPKVSVLRAGAGATNTRAFLAFGRF